MLLAEGSQCLFILPRKGLHGAQEFVSTSTCDVKCRKAGFDVALYTSALVFLAEYAFLAIANHKTANVN